MKSNFYLSVLALFIFTFSTSLHAQLFIDTNYTAEEMVMDFFDNSCVTPSNITYTGAPNGFAFFDAGNTNLSIPAGMLLSTGNVLDAVGPNTQPGTSGQMGSEGDPDLDNLLMGFTSFDGSILEFDILVEGDQLDFSYIFASEEYLEFVNTGFNDIFAFFISGPGISGIQNIAMVPNTPDPVSINTINNLTNDQYFTDNAGGQDIEFDGYTTELIATVATMPNETYHVKIAIADVSDQVFDSGIFLGIQSLCGDPLLVPPAQGNVSIDGMTITFENLSKYATSYLWDFGDNTTSTEKNPAPHTYATDGVYDINLMTQNYCCSDTFTTTITVGSPVSVDELEIKPYQLAPNPFRDVIQLQTELSGPFSIKIFDASGKLILTKIDTNERSVNLSGFDTGVYFAEIKLGDTLYREKLLKL